MTGLDEFHPATTTNPANPTTTTPTDEQFSLAVALVRAEGEIVRLREALNEAELLLTDTRRIADNAIEWANREKRKREGAAE